jgi:uncharacterized protein (DUF488 family)
MPGRLFTIGFTKTSAAHFFERLRMAGVRTVIDVRLNTTSQLAGFAKAGDLAYFLGRIGGIGYRAEPLLAPTQELLARYRGRQFGWDDYEVQFRDLIRERRIEDRIERGSLEDACLLCSEATPHKCHRRVVCDHLSEAWGKDLEVRHL